MNLRLITAPTTEPVSVETVKAFLRVDGSEENALITSLAQAAREKGEELARRAFITQTWEMIIDAWPVNGCLKIYRPPLQSIESVTYVDRDNAEHTWTDYVMDNRSEPGAVIFNSLPSEELLKSGAITVRFVAGFGDAADDVPQRIKNSILALIAYWYENRESHDVPNTIKDAFIDERVVWF